MPGSPPPQPACAGSRRRSKRPSIGTKSLTAWGASAEGKHSSIGGRTSGSAKTSSGPPERAANRSRSPQVTVALIRVTPSWLSSTWAVATDPPSRRTTTLTSPGPGAAADRKCALVASGSGLPGSSARRALPMSASRNPPLTPPPTTQPAGTSTA